jgi:guanidinoacetate N-methyltransferase
MTQRIKRTPNFELTLNVKNDSFIRPPRDTQRSWLLSRAMNEFGRDLDALHNSAAVFVAGGDAIGPVEREQAALSDDEIMEDWQIPLMEAMAAAVTHNRGSVLEIGFGRGVGSALIQQAHPRRHTIIECNDTIVERYHNWRAGYPNADITLAHGLWQDVLDDLGEFDGIFFHTYPLNEDEFIDHISRSVTFAEHFFEHAANHLLPGGVFAYPSFEIDSLGRGHQRALFEHFSRIELAMQPLQVPDNVRDAWWSDTMVLVKAIR